MSVVHDAVRDAAGASAWLCDDGHKHPRPSRFTLNRLRLEINRRNRHNLWPSATIGCAIYDLIDAGVLRLHRDFTLSPVSVPEEDTWTDLEVA